MQPLIGITGDLRLNPHRQPVTELNEAYSRSVAAAGGLPLLIPAVLDAVSRKQLFSRLDGILFSGGGDIEPAHYGAAHGGRLVGVHAERDELELDLLSMAVSDEKPFLGICRGCQLLNVGLGGTLYPDLPTDPGGTIQHDQPGSERAALVHDVRVVEGTRLARILGENSIDVNSHHHQGLKDLSPRLRIAGHASDGLVEAVELPEHPFGLAVQWHPEWLTQQSWTRQLFEQFVRTAAGQP